MPLAVCDGLHAAHTLKVRWFKFIQSNKSSRFRIRCVRVLTNNKCNVSFGKCCVGLQKFIKHKWQMRLQCHRMENTIKIVYGFFPTGFLFIDCVQWFGVSQIVIQFNKYYEKNFYFICSKWAHQLFQDHTVLINAYVPHYYVDYVMKIALSILYRFRKCETLFLYFFIQP